MSPREPRDTLQPCASRSRGSRQGRWNRPSKPYRDEPTASVRGMSPATIDLAHGVRSSRGRLVAASVDPPVGVQYPHRREIFSLAAMERRAVLRGPHRRGGVRVKVPIGALLNSILRMCVAPVGSLAPRSALLPHPMCPNAPRLRSLAIG